MAKNLIPQIAKMLGVEMGEKFNVKGIDDIDDWVQAYLTKDGLMLLDVYMHNGDAHKYLARLITGKLEHRKLPWEPKDDEKYWSISFVNKLSPYVESYIWNGDDTDFFKLKLGMVYRTQAEARAHLAEDYERLTGKPLSSR